MTLMNQMLRSKWVKDVSFDNASKHWYVVSSVHEALGHPKIKSWQHKSKHNKDVSEIPPKTITTHSNELHTRAHIATCAHESPQQQHFNRKDETQSLIKHPIRFGKPLCTHHSIQTAELFKDHQFGCAGTTKTKVFARQANVMQSIAWIVSSIPTKPHAKCRMNLLVNATLRSIIENLHNHWRVCKPRPAKNTNTVAIDNEMVGYYTERGFDHYKCIFRTQTEGHTIITHHKTTTNTRPTNLLVSKQHTTEQPDR